MGIRTILNAKRIILMAWGTNKAEIISKAIEGKIDSKIPCSNLQNHKNATVVLDREASNEITKYKTPWLVGSCKWDESLMLKAVIWLSQNIKKPIIKLTDEDYNRLVCLKHVESSSYALNIKIFNQVQKFITGWLVENLILMIIDILKKYTIQNDV